MTPPPDESPRGNAKRQNGADAAAPNQNELERVRSILFGESMRDLQGLLARSAAETAERLDDLRATIEQRHAALEAKIEAVRHALNEHRDAVGQQMQRRVDRGQLADLLRGVVDRIDKPGAVDHADG